jgi:hypothetical protein
MNKKEIIIELVIPLAIAIVVCAVILYKIATAYK